MEQTKTHIKDFIVPEHKELLKVYKTYDIATLNKTINALKYRLLQIRIQASVQNNKELKSYAVIKKNIARLFTEINSRKK
ncbi:MAG: 50S ribosomal protein L29 [Rickettsiales bacterium]